MSETIETCPTCHLSDEAYKDWRVDCADKWHADAHLRRPRCPTCASTQRNVHGAVRQEGEVQPCKDLWHVDPAASGKDTTINFRFKGWELPLTRGRTVGLGIMSEVTGEAADAPLSFLMHFHNPANADVGKADRYVRMSPEGLAALITLSLSEDFNDLLEEGYDRLKDGTQVETKVAAKDIEDTEAMEESSNG